MSRAITAGSTGGLSDAEAFVHEAASSPLFDPGVGLTVARAPGRLDLMGGIADYSGSLVLQWPLIEATLAALQLSSDRNLRVVSLAGPGRERSFSASLDDIFPGGAPLEYAAAQSWFADRPEAWAAYALGAVLVLVREKGVRFETGLRLLLRSSVPEGSGVSSSAALEVAVMQALSAARGLALDPRELAVLCQTVENRVVGAACGVMDQMTAACGRAHELLALLCQPAEVLGTIPLPPQFEVWGIDSGVRHSVSGSSYTSVRVAAFMGARILAELAGFRVAPGAPGEPLRIEDTRWRGFLANLTPAELESEFLERLPETLHGADFLARYGGIADGVTRVEPGRTYPVRSAAAHPVYEHTRVRHFAEALQRPLTEPDCRRLGELMLASHASYSACGLGSEATDLLVSLVQRAGPERGFLGAKITGGGCGGTVAVLGRRGADIAAIAAAFADRSGYPPRIFSGSSPGSSAFGFIRLGSRLETGAV